NRNTEKPEYRKTGIPKNRNTEKPEYRYESNTEIPIGETTMIVTIANAKGGVAKTTSAIYLAAAYARRFEEGATVLDADPQSSASLWRDMAEENGGWPAGTDVMPANLSTLQRLARAGHGGFAVVDAPPQGRLFEESVKAADFVVVPTSDSPIDLQQAWATMNAIPDGKPGAVLIVRAEPRTRAFQATVAALDEAGTPRFDAVVCKRQDIKAGMGHSPDKLHEYPQVLGEIVEAMGARA
ncbi:ParA family protein, partial [Bifidobacterium longum]